MERENKAEDMSGNICKRFIIDPSTLSEEQREAIRNMYNARADIIHDYEEIDRTSTLTIVTDLFEALFGSEFFQQKGE